MGACSAYTYDQNENLASLVDLNNITTSFGYDTGRAADSGRPRHRAAGRPRR